MKPSSAKAKGRRLLKEVKARLLRTFGHLQDDDMVVTSAGTTGEDLQLSPAARDCVPFTIEGKNQERLNIWAAFKQAEEHRDEYPPMVVFTRNRTKVYAAVELDDMLELLRRAWDSWT